MSKDHIIEDALLTKSQQIKNYKKNNNPTSNYISANNYNKENSEKKDDPSYQHCDKMGHPP